MGLDLEPDLEPRLRLPDGNHFGTGIAGDHRRLSNSGKLQSWAENLLPLREKVARSAG
jgi:hypothetical protein